MHRHRYVCFFCPDRPAFCSGKLFSAVRIELVERCRVEGAKLPLHILVGIITCVHGNLFRIWIQLQAPIILALHKPFFILEKYEKNHKITNSTRV